MKTDEKPKRGGKREGSGRKPKMKDDARSLFYSLVDERWERIMEKLDEYIEKGYKDILKMIIEQRIGKPPQPLVGGGEGSEPILMQWQK